MKHHSIVVADNSINTNTYATEWKAKVDFCPAKTYGSF